MPDLRIAWWNVESLFAHLDAPRPAELQSKVGGSLANWTVAARDRKIGRLASIIELMFNGAGPDILGVCEVENETVAQMLANQINIPGRSYRVVGHDSPDARGIDVLFLYDDNLIRALESDYRVVVSPHVVCSVPRTYRCLGHSASTALASPGRL